MGIDQEMTDFHAGVFLVDKPAGMTSFGVVRRVKKLLNIKKVGHAGTLDPFATGLLIVCAGRPATRLISSFMDGEKEYIATLKLGERTTTLDPEGEVTRRCDVGTLQAGTIADCLTKFTGRQLQKPPQYSALKHKGKPLYYYARKGIKVEKEPREIFIDCLERVDGDKDVTDQFPELKIRVVCSKGTYIRSLADDIGNALGCGAHLVGLRRTRSGVFTIENAVEGDALADESKKSEILSRMMTVEDVGKLLQ